MLYFRTRSGQFLSTGRFFSCTRLGLPTLLSLFHYWMHSFDTLSNPTTRMELLLMKFTVSWNLSQLPCINCTRTSTLRLDSRNLHPSLFARRGLRSPEDHPLLLAFIIFVAIVVPLLCLYGIRLYARRRRAEEREDIEASLRHRLELQRNIDRLERDFMIPGSVAEPLPPYFPRPPAYSFNMDGANFRPVGNAHIASPDETKLTAPLTVHSRQRSATCFPALEHSCSGGSQNCTQ
ncbi:hypothetical protein F5050DRAFT_795211 [Lentinula boryana]|uniref:Uncharacterized protein n=1 Tax=Lentinula boryana TaxID=40481 RepID=A0ABQ8QU39_9AGAR|nr:hypothetical protein F5050DRAFT_795211 [Lentinula boryana]